MIRNGIRLLLVILALSTACGTTAPLAADPSPVAPDRACVTPAPRRPDAELTVARQSVSRTGIWRAFPGWTIPVAIDGSYHVSLTIPTTDGWGYDHMAFRVRVESAQWGIAQVLVQPRTGSPWRHLCCGCSIRGKPCPPAHLRSFPTCSQGYPAIWGLIAPLMAVKLRVL